MLQVTVSFGDEVLARATFKSRVVTIGRAPDNTIQVDHPSLSRSHARLEPQGQGWLLRDLGSTNGVIKDGERVAEWSLNDGDEVLLGEYRLTFALDDEDGPPPSLPALPEHLADLAVLGATFHTASTPALDHGARERSSNLRGHLFEEATGRCFLVERDAFVAGDDAAADLRVAGLLAPRIGAVIVRGYGGFSVVNVAGRDGWVRVDGEPIPGAVHLASGARLQLGPRSLRFVHGAPPAGFEVVSQTSRARRP